MKSLEWEKGVDRVDYRVAEEMECGAMRWFGNNLNK